jgi:hypothetical protein
VLELKFIIADIKSAYEKDLKEITDHIGNIRGITTEDPHQTQRIREREELLREIEDFRKILKTSLKTAITSEEKEMEMIVELLESKSGLKAPEEAHPHEKISWLISEINELENDKKLEILELLLANSFEDFPLAERISESIKKDLLENIKHNNKDHDSDVIKELLEETIKLDDESEQGKLEIESFIKDMKKLYKRNINFEKKNKEDFSQEEKDNNKIALV